MSQQHPGLTELSPPFDQVVGRLIGDLPEFATAKGVSRIVPLRYLERPYSRLLHMELVGPGARWRGFAKICQAAPVLENDRPTERERARGEFALLEELTHLLRNEPSLGVPRPVACYDDLSAIVTAEAPGHTLAECVQNDMHWLAPRARRSSTLHACFLVGTFLKRLRTATLRSDRHFDLDEMRCYVERRLENIVRLGGSRRDQGWINPILNAFDRLASTVSGELLPMCTLHGDLSLGNTLVHPEGIVILDCAMTACGHPFHDVTHFEHALDQLRYDPRIRPGTSAALQTAFREGSDHGELNQPSLLQLFRMQHVCCQLSRLSHVRAATLAGRIHDRFLFRQGMSWLTAFTNSSPRPILVKR